MLKNRSKSIIEKIIKRKILKKKSYRRLEEKEFLGREKIDRPRIAELFQSHTLYIKETRASIRRT